MSALIAIVGVSGVGKTALAAALANARPATSQFSSEERSDRGDEAFETAYEQHAERPFQSLFKDDPRYGLANQIDYYLFRADQEKRLRASSRIGLIDGGLDLDFHAFTRLFHYRRLLSDAEFELCRRTYEFIREHLPRPELIVHIQADEETVARRLSHRARINIARAEDTVLFDSFVGEWLASLPPEQILELDVSTEALEYPHSTQLIFDRIQALSLRPEAPGTIQGPKNV